MKGKHLLADVHNISNIEIIKTVDGVETLMEKNSLKNELEC